MLSRQQIIHPIKDPLFLSDLENTSQSVLMKDIFDKVLSLSKRENDVIIIGEIGSGKKRISQIIHVNSNRAKGPFHSFYCVDINENEYKDAFWEQLRFEKEHIILEYDAVEKASGGILYLDKFSDLPPEFMINIVDSYLKSCKQLFRYVTAERPRLIISLNQESYHKILNTSVWETLLQQLNPFTIMLPPLRERKEDIPFFVEVFLQEIRDLILNSEKLTISDQALQECKNYSWPGNIRQLKNALFQGAVLSHGQTIESHHLPFSMRWKLPYDIEDNKNPSKL